jgi:hypothetical protein|tara:strand:+ start:284 stop:817 length:534 start_codon:yes stop_codon:yes gene_type:complete
MGRKLGSKKRMKMNKCRSKKFNGRTKRKKNGAAKLFSKNEINRIQQAGFPVVVHTQEEAEKLGKEFPRLFGDKRWRDKILCFHSKAAKFIYDNGIISSRSFEPCIKGAVISTERNVLQFRTDTGDYFVPYGTEEELNEMLYDVDVVCGTDITFKMLFQQSLFEHGILKKHPLLAVYR